MSEVRLVGILNRTLESFSDGGQYFDIDKAVNHTYEMFNHGASMVDVGAESTKPGATPMTHAEEWPRLEPLLHQIMPGNTDSISVDTYHPETVRRIAAEIGPFVVNDVTGMNNPRMREAVAELGLRCIISHLPESAGQDIQAAHDTKPTTSVDQVATGLGKQIDLLTKDGVDKSGIYVDPGFAFGKDPKINNDLLELPHYMGRNEFEYYIGVSRKSSLRRQNFYGKLLANFDAMDKKATDDWLDNRSVEVAKIAVANGFTWIRVHNVKAHAVLL